MIKKLSTLEASKGMKEEQRSRQSIYEFNRLFATYCIFSVERFYYLNF